MINEVTSSISWLSRLERKARDYVYRLMTDASAYGTRPYSLNVRVRI